jgi:hypothetical protein
MIGLHWTKEPIGLGKRITHLRMLKMCGETTINAKWEHVYSGNGVTITLRSCSAERLSESITQNPEEPITVRLGLLLTQKKKIRAAHAKEKQRI